METQMKTTTERQTGAVFHLLETGAKFSVDDSVDVPSQAWLLTGTDR